MELAYVYVDCGDARYKKLVHEMVQSARRVMPDVKITQISDKKTPLYPGSDALFTADLACDKDSICAFKGHFMADFACQCDGSLILCDVDLIWQHRPIIEMADCDLGVMYRNNLPAMPINTSIIISTPLAIPLWDSYRDIVDNLHGNNMGGWYCDQIAAAIAWLREPKVLALPMNKWSYAPESKDDINGIDSYAIHLKGDRKQWLPFFLGAA